MVVLLGLLYLSLRGDFAEMVDWNCVSRKGERIKNFSVWKGEEEFQAKGD